MHSTNTVSYYLASAFSSLSLLRSKQFFFTFKTIHSLASSFPILISTWLEHFYFFCSLVKFDHKNLSTSCYHPQSKIRLCFQCHWNPPSIIWCMHKVVSHQVGDVLRQLFIELIYTTIFFIFIFSVCIHVWYLVLYLNRTRWGFKMYCLFCMWTLLSTEWW